MADDGRVNEVRGPTSALTSFLKSKNIRVQNANRFRRRDTGEAPSTSPARASEGREGREGSAASPAAAAAAAPAESLRSPAAAAPRARQPPARRPLGASMSFTEEDGDDDEDEDEGAVADTSTNADITIDRGEGSSRGAESRANGAAATLGQASHRHTAPGSIDFCAMCSKRFSVTAYTHQTPAGGLCHRCGGQAKASGSQSSRPSLGDMSSAVDTPPPKKKIRRKPNQQPHDMRQIPTLQELCINIVAHFIEDVEALRGIGGQNMDRISKSISKNRRLNSHTMMLFLQAGAKQISFYDCSQIDGEALASIPKFCPNVESINLQLCGMIDNQTLDTWGEKLHHLQRVELYGPFLVRVEAWHRFFERVGGRLTTLKIRESPRFDKECCEKLLVHCPNVQELGLAQIGKMNAECLAVIRQYGHQLTYLDISDPGVSAPGVPPESLKDEEVIDLLKHVGTRLTHLDISRNADLTGRTLLEGIRDNCTSLEDLYMTLLHTDEKVESSHFVDLFQGLQEKGCAKLMRVSLERCMAVDDEAVTALVSFCGPSLVEINLNSCDGITETGFRTIAEGCPNLRKIDVGFCRSITDGLVMDFAAHMPRLEEVWVFSCNKISTSLASDRVRLIGKEKYATV